MKLLCHCLILGGTALLPASAFADDLLPRRSAFARYQPMLDHSPFAVATAVVPTEAPDFARDLYVANAARWLDGGMVTIASSTDRNFKKYLTVKEPVDGYAVTDIEWSDRLGATKVTITKDGKYATLTFNQALLSQPVANSAVAMPPFTASVQNQGPVFGTAPNFIKPAPIPSLPAQQVPPALQNRAHTRGLIQRNPATIATPMPLPTPVPPPDSDDNG